MIKQEFDWLADVPKGFTGIALLPYSTVWYKNGLLHREDGPAVQHTTGTNEWWVNGKRHRVDGPAVEQADGTKEWWINGKLHREDGPAIIYETGTLEWYLNGCYHRIDGPAIETSSGGKSWYINGNLHREDGPAIIDMDGNKAWFFKNFLVFYLKPLEDYISIQDGLPCDVEWVSHITQCKVLTDEGIMYLPNLPGMPHLVSP
jgi:hypothetical protein